MQYGVLKVLSVVKKVLVLFAYVTFDVVGIVSSDAIEFSY